MSNLIHRGNAVIKKLIRFVNAVINLVNSVINFILRHTASLVTGARVFFHTFNLGHILRLAGHKAAIALRNTGIYIGPQKGQSGKPLCTVLLALFLIWVIIFSLFPLYCLIGGRNGRFTRMGG
jgi:hypothetical protein